MKTQNIVIGAALAAALGSTAVAQQPSSTQSDRDTRQGRSTVTITGCLQPAQAGLAGGGAAGGGAASSTSRSSEGDRFMLTNATMGSGSRSDSAAPAAGAGAGAGAAAGASTGTSYMLEGKTSDLRKHVNQQVEVTGRLDSAASGSTSGSSTRTGSTDPDTTQRSDKTSAGGAGASSPSASGTGQRLHVESVRQVSASCSR
jgi:hypothetical protein